MATYGPSKAGQRAGLTRARTTKKGESIAGAAPHGYNACMHAVA
jgi:hypothetical protein